MSSATVKVPLPLSLPRQLVEEIVQWGIRLDRSGSWLLGAAWNLSRDWVASLDHEGAECESGSYNGDQAARNWFIPAETMLEIAHAAQRLRIPPEGVVELAWNFSRPGP